MNEIMDKVRINNINYCIDELEKDCWIRLLNGAIKSRDPFHTFCVATQNNGEINIRTVVLRKAILLSRLLRFHTDIRSMKWKDLQSNNSISCLFYDPKSRIQIRAKGKAKLHFNDDITIDEWQKTTLTGRRSYLTHFSPSSFTELPTSGLPVHIEQDNFTLEESEIGQQNFGIVSIRVESIEWLCLNDTGHRRAYFDYIKNSYRWMIP